MSEDHGLAENQDQSMREMVEVSSMRSMMSVYHTSMNNYNNLTASIQDESPDKQLMTHQALEADRSVDLSLVHSLKRKILG